MAKTNEQKIQAANERYNSAAHAMQTGVAALMGAGDEQELQVTGPKHLRVGVNSAMVNQDALVRLLIANGIISDVEYFEALADAMERERDAYQERVNKKYGTSKIVLG